MGRIAENKLTLQPVENDPELFILSGYMNGKRYRKQSRDLAKLTEFKASVENAGLAERVAVNDRHPLPLSWITPAQLRDAEAALEVLKGRFSLVECVRVGVSILGDGEPVKVTEALAQWKAWQVENHYYPRTVKKNEQRIKAFMKATSVEMVGEIASRQIERHCLRPKIGAYTQLGDARVIRAFLNFCTKRKYLRASPFEMDLESLKSRADRLKERPRILTPDQCAALLKAAIETDNGSHVAYVILALFCFMRSAEAERVTSDDIHFNGTTTVSIVPHKARTASYRAVTVPEGLVPLLKACVDRGMITREKSVGLDRDTVWDNIRAKAGLIKVRHEKRLYKGRDHTVKYIDNLHWQENILRHTGVSYFHQQCGSITEVARQAGHSTDTAFKHYLRLPKDGDAAKFYAITGKLTPEAEPVAMAG